jgi:chromosome segregation ATPase
MCSVPQELQKLRKKINITVHILSHYTEKLEFVHSANNVLKQKLSVLEHALTKLRNELSGVKLDRDHVKEDIQVCACVPCLRLFVRLC